MSRPARRCRRLGRGALATAALLLLSCATAQAAFRTDNLKPGKAIQPRPDQALVFGTLQVLDEAGHAVFPSDDVFPRVPRLQLFGIAPRGKRTFSLQGLDVHPDGTFAAWIPAGDYLLTATWPDEQGDLGLMSVAAIRLPGDGRVFYTGELVTETVSTGVLWKNFPPSYEVTNVTAIAGAIETARKKVERRSGPLPGPVSVLLWCTDGVPPQADPGNARSIARLDAGCGSTITDPEQPANPP